MELLDGDDTGKIYRAMKKTILLVTGMHCSNCVMSVTKALKKIFGVSDVTVNLGTGRANIEYDESKAGILLRIVQRPKQVPLRRQQSLHLPSIPDMISARNHMNAHIEKLFDILLGDALPLVHIFTIRDAEVDLVLLDILLQERRHQCHAGFAVDISNEEYVQMLGHKCSPGISMEQDGALQQATVKRTSIGFQYRGIHAEKKGVSSSLKTKGGDRFARTPP